MVSVMFYPCIFCINMSMDLFVLCVASLTGFVNWLVKQFAIFLGVVVIVLLNVMEVLSVGEVLCWIYHVLSSKECVYCACDPSVHLDSPSIGFACVCVCRKLSLNLRV